MEICSTVFIRMYIKVQRVLDYPLPSSLFNYLENVPGSIEGHAHSHHEAHSGWLMSSLNILVIALLLPSSLTMSSLPAIGL